MQSSGFVQNHAPMSKTSKKESRREDRKAVRENLNLRSPVIYEIIRQEGIEELNRPLQSLWWSGIAAGAALSMSVYCEGFLHLHLPDQNWRPLVENLGYIVGFLIVILSRFQLFTENTITVILPLLNDPRPRTLALAARLWGIVFIANMVGSLLSVALVVFGGAINEPQLAAAMEISHHMMDKSALEVLQHGIPAGFLIAALVWCLPSAKGSEFWIIALLTYVIALGDFTHVVAGSTEVFLLLLNGDLSIFDAVFKGIGPAFIGNVIGGTGLFTMIAYGQIKEEV